MTRILVVRKRLWVLACALLLVPVACAGAMARQASKEKIRVVLISVMGRSQGVEAAVFSPDGKQIATENKDGTAQIWDARTGKLLYTLNDVNSIAFSPDNSRIVTGATSGGIQLWDAVTRKPLRALKGHPFLVHSVAFSSDGKRIVSCGIFIVIIWDTTTGKPLQTIKGHDGLDIVGSCNVAFSPDGKRIVTTSWREARVWDVATGKHLLTLKGHIDNINSVAVTVDGRRVVTVSSDYTVRFWDSATGRKRGRPIGHSGPIGSLAISPDGKHIVTASDGKIRILDAKTGKYRRTFKAEQQGIQSVAISPNSRRIATGGWDGSLKIWHLQTGELFVTIVGGLGEKWVTLTPEGFFARSPNVNDLLTIVRGHEVTSIEQVHQSLYNPDLVREKLSGDPDKEFARAAKVVNLEKVLDSGQVPSVEIIGPNAAAQTTADLVNAVATITDTGGGIGRIEWRVNGITAGVETPPKGRGKTITVTRQLALDPGENTIEVVAYNGRNLKASLPARTTIEWQGAAEAGKGRLYVLAIGIDAYNDKKFRRLSLAVKDAKAFGAALEAAGKEEYASVHIVPALDGDATPAKLEQLIDRMARDITPRDTFILFAAAHGTSKDGRFYLIPYGYNSDAPGTLAEKAIGQDRLQDWVANRIKARKALILLDTCESGALVGAHTKSRVDAPASEAAVGRLHEATGRPVLTAAASGKAALEGYKGHGIFTWALLDALKNGDTSGNGIIELSELAAHVQALVPKLSAEIPRGALTVPVRENTARYAAFRQSARFGSRGENFVIARRLQ